MTQKELKAFVLLEGLSQCKHFSERKINSLRPSSLAVCVADTSLEYGSGKFRAKSISWGKVVRLAKLRRFPEQPL